MSKTDLWWGPFSVFISLGPSAAALPAIKRKSKRTGRSFVFIGKDLIIQLQRRRDPAGSGRSLPDRLHPLREAPLPALLLRA